MAIISFIGVFSLACTMLLSTSFAWELGSYRMLTSNDIHCSSNYRIKGSILTRAGCEYYFDFQIYPIRC